MAWLTQSISGYLIVWYFVYSICISGAQTQACSWEIGQRREGYRLPYIERNVMWSITIGDNKFNLSLFIMWLPLQNQKLGMQFQSRVGEPWMAAWHSPVTFILLYISQLTVLIWKWETFSNLPSIAICNTLQQLQILSPINLMEKDWSISSTRRSGRIWELEEQHAQSLV